jgi:hypothetical protein
MIRVGKELLQFLGGFLEVLISTSRFGHVFHNCVRSRSLRCVRNLGDVRVGVGLRGEDEAPFEVLNPVT